MKIVIISNASLGKPARYGIGELVKTLREHGVDIKESETLGDRQDKKIILIGNVHWSLFEQLKFQNRFNVPSKRESYVIAKTDGLSNNIICIIGRDDWGVEYGCFDLIEQMGDLPEINNIFSQLSDRSESPDLSVRGLCIFLHNTDLEKRWLYSIEFWNDYFCMLAHNRYNEFTIIFGQQTARFIPIYPYLFKIEEYPDVYVEGISETDREKNLHMLQYISGLAEKRGIKFFAGIWQSKVWTPEIMGGQQSKVHGVHDDMLPDYTRKGITKLLKLCPGIKGIQLRMNRESGVADQSFFTNVFIPGVKKSGREIEVEIRNWGLKPETLEEFRKAFPKLRVSMKYFAEHHGMSYQPVIMQRDYSCYDSLLRNDKKYDVLLHLWNLGTHRLFLWGDPDHVRRFVDSCHLGDALGFLVDPPLSQKGMSQFGEIPGYWSIYKRSVQHDYYTWEYERYWFFYQLWGRLGYNPKLSNEIWLKELVRRFGKEAAPHILRAYSLGSQVLSYLICHHMADPNMYIWLEIDHGGLIDYFSRIIPGEKTLFMNSEEYAEKRIGGIPSAKITPFQASRDLKGFAQGCEQELRKIDQIQNMSRNKEYHFTKVDLKALSLLARYNSEKIGASAYLTLFYETNDYLMLKRAKSHVKSALQVWKELIDLTNKYFYHKLQLGPNGGHWRDNLPYVEYDLRRVEKVEEIFKSYGIFNEGFDFGATLPKAKPKPDERSESVERRFKGVFPTTKYCKELGYGWQEVSQLFAKEAPFVGIHGLRGVNCLELNKKISNLPGEMLSPDFVGSKNPASFLVDIPDGKYRLTFLIGDTSESPEDYGFVDISINGEKKIANFEVPKGRIEVIEEKVEVHNRQLKIDFNAGKESRWIINGLIITELKPHIGHLFVDKAPTNKDLFIKATVASIIPLANVQLFHKTNECGDYQMIEMSREENLLWGARIPRAELDKDEVKYFIQAEDTRGNTSYSPEGGSKAPFCIRLINKEKVPKIAEHKEVSSHQSDWPVTLTVKVDNEVPILGVKLYYKKIVQKERTKTIWMKKDEKGVYVGTIPDSELSPLYDILYYFEVLDEFGNGSFYPDPFIKGRYFVIHLH